MYYYVYLQDLFNDDDLLFSPPSSAATTTKHSTEPRKIQPTETTSSSSSELCKAPSSLLPAKPGGVGISVSAGDPGTLHPHKLIPSSDTSWPSSTSKDVNCSSVKQSAAQKLDSFKFVKISNSRKRNSSDDNEATPLHPKRKSLDNDDEAIASLLNREEVSASDGILMNREASLGCLDSDMNTETTDIHRHNLTSEKAPLKQSGFSTPSNVATPAELRSSGSLQASFTTPTKPPSHRNSIASIVRTIRQSSNPASSCTSLSSQTASTVPQQPVLGDSTPSRKSTPLNYTPLRGQSAPGHSSTTPLGRQSAPGHYTTTPLGRQSTPGSSITTPLGRQSAPGNFTPMGGQPAALNLRRAGFSTPLNRQSAPPGDGYSTPQPTPLVCTPSTDADSCGVDIVRTPVLLAKRKFPGPAGLLPPLVQKSMCTDA